MRPLVGALALRAVTGARREPAAGRRRRRRAGVTLGIAALIAVSVLATRAVADGYQLEFGFAKRALSRETAALCSSTAGCANWSVGPCRRQSWHRVDCVSRLYGESGVACNFVGIAVWPPSSDHLLIHRKRIRCSPGGARAAGSGGPRKGWFRAAARAASR